MPVCSAQGNQQEIESLRGTRTPGTQEPQAGASPASSPPHAPPLASPHAGECTQAPPRRLVPSGWRGSASPARLNRTAACRPPAAAAQPGRWSPWQRGAPRWPSGSPGWPAEPPAAPAQERPRETADRPGPVITPPQEVGIPRVCTGTVLLCMCSRGAGQAPAGTCRRWMGRMEGLLAWDPADPDALAGSRSELRGSRVAHVQQVCRLRAFTEMRAFARGAEGSVPSSTPAQTRGLVHSSGESKGPRENSPATAAFWVETLAPGGPG